MIINLERTYLPSQTKGTLYCGDLELQTLERPWLGNRSFVSCIPEGHYVLSPWVSHKFGKCYIVDGGTVGRTAGVRTHILFHAANKVSELLGCVAVGKRWEDDELRDSAKAVKQLYAILEWQEAKLVITEKRSD